ncbi:MAG: SGNH/GDSL hydrolase family protein [Lachnospiraceae bacterium]|nr:SGNH/GDSL hydrolase family protein [Lachnospiraceae bacterium]
MITRNKLFPLIMSLIATVLIFIGLQRLVEPKYDGSEDMPLEGNFTSEYYDETTKHDVIIIGDCEVYENIDAMRLWDKYGITSYIRGNAQQLIWQSYYMLEDTLKTETPKVVIYNVQAMEHSKPEREAYNRMTLDGMKWSKTKLDAIRASMCEGENYMDYFFPLLRYHSRITSLNGSDLKYYFRPKKVAHNGYYMRIDTLPVSESDVADDSWLSGEEDNNVDEEVYDDPMAMFEQEMDIDDDSSEPKDEDEVKISDTSFAYLERIRNLCNDNGIKLILMKAPSLYPVWHDSENEQISDYAKANGLLYVNFYDLIDEIGIDYEKDTYDGGLHLNLTGADKVADYLGDVLIKQYKIKDHRNEPLYQRVYDGKYQFYQDMIKAQQKELDKYGEILSY